MIGDIIMSKRKKQHTVSALVAAQVQELFAKHQKDCLIFVVDYIKDKRRYYEAKYLFGTSSELLHIRIDKQHTNATLEALKTVLPKVNCSDCKVIVLSATPAQLSSPDSIPKHDAALWREVRVYLDTHHLQTKDIIARDASQVHSIIRDQNLFKTEIKLRKQKEQKSAKVLQSRDLNTSASNNDKDTIVAQNKTSNKTENKSAVKKSKSKKNSKAQRNTCGRELYYSHADVFSIARFIKDHFDEHCLFVSGSKHEDEGTKYSRGEYQYIINYKDTSVHVKDSTIALRSANDVMLSGIIRALKENVTNDSTVNIVIYTKLGFEHPDKSANKALLQDIFQIRQDKNLKLNVYLIHKGTDKIRKYVERRK